MENREFKSTIDKVVQEKEERLKQLEDRYKQYLETRDSRFVIDCFSFPYALQEIRLVEIIEKWKMEHRYDLLDKVLTRPPGISKDAYHDFRRNCLMVIEVDVMVSQGVKKEEAFKRLTSFMGLTRAAGTVKKAYYRTRKKMYQLYIEDMEDFYILTVYYAPVSYDGVEFFAPYYKVNIPKDSTRADELTTVEGKLERLDDEAFQSLYPKMTEYPFS